LCPENRERFPKINTFKNEKQKNVSLRTNVYITVVRRNEREYSIKSRFVREKQSIPRVYTPSCVTCKSNKRRIYRRNACAYTLRLRFRPNLVHHQRRQAGLFEIFVNAAGHLNAKRRDVFRV